MDELGSIYGTTVDGLNTLVIDFSNVEINGMLTANNDASFNNINCNSIKDANVNSYIEFDYEASSGDTAIQDAIFIRGRTGYQFGILFESGVIQSWQPSTTAFANMDLNPYGGTVFAGSNNVSSDDRIKFNERDITNGLDIVRQINPERYLKKKPAEKGGIQEAGFIAQKIMNIPELSFAVSQSDVECVKGDPNTRYYYVDYTSVYAYVTAGVKELDTIVQNQQTEIEELKNALNTLLSEAGKPTI